MKKRLLCAAMVLLMCIVNMAIPAYADTPYAEIIFESPIKKTNIKERLSGSPAILKKDGKTALRRMGPGELYVYMQIDQEFYETTEPQPIKVIVEYFDEGKGSFSLSYNGTNNQPIGNVMYSDSEQICQMEDSLTWKTFEFHIDDMILGQGMAGDSTYDVRVGGWTNRMGTTIAPVYIRSIRLEKTLPKIPVKIDVNSDYVGNMFDTNEEKVMKINLTNITEFAASSKVKYYYQDENGVKLGEGEFDENVPAKETVTHNIPLDISNKNAIYKMFVETESNLESVEETFTATKMAELSVFQKFRKGDARNDNFFSVVHFTYDDCIELYRDMLLWSGFGGIREGGLTDWSEWEKEKGVYTVPEWVPGALEVVRDSEVKFLAGSIHTNKLYEPDTPFSVWIIPHEQTTREGMGRFDAYIEEYMESVGLGDRLVGLELWNEPNVGGGGNFNHYGVNDPRGDASVYAGYQKVAYETIKAAGATTPVVGISTSMCDVEYFKKVFENGGYDTVDAVSIHPYDWSGGFRIQKWIDEVGAVKQLMEDYGGAKPIINTEMGFSSADSKDGVKDEKMQAAYLLESFIVGRGEDLVDITCNYVFMEKGAIPTDREDCFGLVRSYTYHESPCSAKPAYLAVVGVNRMLAGAEPAGSIKRDDNIWCYNFTRPDGKNVAVCWAYGTDENVCFDLGTGNVEVYDLYANKTADLTAQDGKYTVKLTEEPMYIVGNFSKFEEGENTFTTESEVIAVPGDTFTVDYSDSLGRTMELDIEAPQHIEVVANNGINNGKGAVTYKLKEEATKKQYIKIQAKENGVIKFIDKLVIEPSVPIEVLVNSSRVTANDDERWQADITITNRSYNNSISGQVKLLGPEEALPYANSPRFNALKPLESVTLHINLDPMIKKRVRTITTEVTLDNGYNEVQNTELNFTMATYAHKKPTIDGMIDIGEWNSSWMAADTKSSAFNYEKWSPENGSITANMLWDEENLYFGAIVSDDVHYQTQTDPNYLWREDSIQIALEDRIDSGKYAFFESVMRELTELGMALINGKPVVYRFLSLYGAPLGVVENCEVEIKRVDGKTYYEARIPWSEIYYEGFEPEGSRQRMAMLVNDHDSDKRKYIEYNGGMYSNKNAFTFGKMTLTK